MALYIGANYHPHDWGRQRWITDIELMKKAGFNTVRLGHLCWDSYEPEEGVYTFEWFDEVMDLFADAEIGVFLDISVRPAPVWVHKLCPGCNIWGKSGMEAASLRRYMEDISDPAYQHYALRFAERFVNRYKSHPALFAFGLCNEIGDGYISHSEFSRKRFVQWLKQEYGTVSALNEAWAARRWSRKLTSFEDAVLQENEIAVGAPEAWLDMRRFFSDGIGDFMVMLAEVVKKEAPGIPHSSNHYAEKENLGFDYLKICDRFVDYPGMGFYPGYGTDEKYQFISSIYYQRLAETQKPMWCLEFQTGSKGTVCGPAGALRMQGLLSLLNRNQMILGWTWRSMLGGEEQYLYGLLGHDGVPNSNYFEYQKLAEDLSKLAPFAFPYLPDPDVAVAYHYDSSWVNQYSSSQFQQSYKNTMTEVNRIFYEKNRDYNVVDLRNLKKDYKLIIIPGHIVMEPEAADTIRNYVKAGGNVIMTAYSATVDETGKVFGTPRPGYLEDAFGIRVAGFYRTDMEWTFSKDGIISEEQGSRRELLRVEKGEEDFLINARYYEVLERNAAASYAEFKSKNMCAVSVNQYGSGKAFYMAAETDREMLGWLLECLTAELGLQKGLSVPEGIQARKIAENQYFYVNTTPGPVRVPLDRDGKGILSGKDCCEELLLEPYEGELLVTGKQMETGDVLEEI